MEFNTQSLVKFEKVNQLDAELNTAGMTLRYNARDGYSVIAGTWGSHAPVMPTLPLPVFFKTKEELLEWGNTILPC